MKEADYIIDMGPGSGKYGGEIVADGTMEELLQNKQSYTAQYLLKEETIPTHFRESHQAITIENACMFNLKNISVHIPTNCLVSITGPSGSGKSTLIFEVLAKRKANISGLEQFDKIVEINQLPLTKMKRSNVATYSEVYSEMRNVFAKTKLAKSEKLSAKYFSFNTAGGRCENCEGLGYLQLGQSLTTLSGGECQRLKLAKELIMHQDSQRYLYLMDEPTIGLHPKDIEHFLKLLDHFIEQGHSVIVVEHNQQVIRHSDWVIDLGPEGGDNGGQIIFEGTPFDLQNSHSITAKYLTK